MKKYLYYENDTIILVSDKRLDYLGDNYIFEEEPEFVENGILKLGKDKKPYYEKPIKDTIEQTLTREISNLKIDSMKEKMINKKLGQEVANLKLKLMEIERSNK